MHDLEAKGSYYLDSNTSSHYLSWSQETTVIAYFDELAGGWVFNLVQHIRHFKMIHLNIRHLV